MYSLKLYHLSFIKKNMMKIFAGITSAERVKNREVAKVHLEILLLLLLLVSCKKGTMSPGDFRINFRGFSGFFTKFQGVFRFFY